MRVTCDPLGGGSWDPQNDLPEGINPWSPWVCLYGLRTGLGTLDASQGEGGAIRCPRLQPCGCEVSAALRVAARRGRWGGLSAQNTLSREGEIKLPDSYCSADLDMDTNFEVILPRRRGLGLCSTALVSYLISLHNDMVYAVGKFSDENNR